MLALVNKVGKLSGIYALGDILTRGIDFLLLFLYTSYLQPDEYGLLAIFTLIISILETLISFGFMSAILRFYYQLPNQEERRIFFGAMWTFLLLVPLLLIMPLSLLGQGVSAHWFGNIPFNPYIRLAIWIAYLNAAFTVLPTMLYRAQEKAGHYVFFNVLRFLAKILAVAWFVILQARGITGIAYAYFYSALAVAVIASLMLSQQLRPNLQWRKLGAALRYSIPLVPHFFAHWGLNVADRAILERFVGLNQVGIYALGYQFGSTYSMLVASCNSAMVAMYSQAAKNKHLYQKLPQLVTYYIGIITYLALVIALLSGQIIVLFTPDAYHNAALIVPLVVLAYWMMGLYYVPMNLLSMTEGKTKIVPVATTCAALVNIGLNLLLIPYLSTIAILIAAITTVIGYCTLTILMYLVAQRQTRFQYEYARLCKTALAGILLYFVGQLAMTSTAWVNLLIAIVVSGLFPLILAVMNFWTAQELSFANKLRQKVTFQIT